MEDRISFWEKAGYWFYKWCYPLALFLAIFLGLLSIATGHYIFGLSSPLSQEGTSVPFGLVIGFINFLAGALLLAIIRKIPSNIAMVIGTLAVLAMMGAGAYFLNFRLAPLF